MDGCRGGEAKQDWRGLSILFFFFQSLKHELPPLQSARGDQVVPIYTYSPELIGEQWPPDQYGDTGGLYDAGLGQS